MFGQGDLAGARRLLNEAMKRFPADAGFDNLLGIIEAQEGNYAAAERSFNQAVARERKFTGAYLNLGRLYQEHAAEDPQALPKALEVYNQALQYEPHNAEANYQSAALLMRRDAYRLRSIICHALRQVFKTARRPYRSVAQIMRASGVASAPMRSWSGCLRIPTFPNRM
ncbi:MAG: tetratricopeptide repeat protein [Chloracidobacterium sp.]|nr:tetratricopeptide repeat protein [Chloracidobacterium sp.]